MILRVSKCHTSEENLEVKYDYIRDIILTVFILIYCACESFLSVRQYIRYIKVLLVLEIFNMLFIYGIIILKKNQEINFFSSLVITTSMNAMKHYVDTRESVEYILKSEEGHNGGLR